MSGDRMSAGVASSQEAVSGERAQTSLSDLLHAVTSLLEGRYYQSPGSENLRRAIGDARTFMPYNDLVRRVPLPRDLDGLTLSSMGVWQMQQRPINRLARELAMAVVEWLASDGDDDKFAVVDRLADQWKATVIDDV